MSSLTSKVGRDVFQFSSLYFFAFDFFDGTFPVVKEGIIEQEIALVCCELTHK